MLVIGLVIGVVLLIGIGVIGAGVGAGLGAGVGAGLGAGVAAGLGAGVAAGLGAGVGAGGSELKKRPNPFVVEPLGDLINNWKKSPPPLLPNCILTG